MLKRKERYDAEFKIIDMLEGKVTDKGGKHVGRMGALVCKTKTGKVFHVGTGYSDAERDQMWHDSPVGKTLRVEYRCLSKDKTPLEPRSLGIRDYA
jgi:DNA ligase-1